MRKNKLHIVVESELKEILQKEAKQNGLSLNAYVRMILIQRGK